MTIKHDFEAFAKLLTPEGLAMMKALQRDEAPPTPIEAAVANVLPAELRASALEKQLLEAKHAIAEQRAKIVGLENTVKNLQAQREVRGAELIVELITCLEVAYGKRDTGTTGCWLAGCSEYGSVADYANLKRTEELIDKAKTTPAILYALELRR